MALFDINMALGRGASPAGDAFDDAGAALAEMGRLGIGDALVYHRVAAEADIALGNRLVIEAAQGHPRLHPCWVVAPPVLGDLPESKAWMKLAADNGVRAVRMLPGHSLYGIADWCAGPLLEAIDDAGLPLLLDYGERHWSSRDVPWNDLDALCTAHPGLSVVLVGATVGEARNLIPLLQAHANLHVELHAFCLPDGLRLLAAEGLIAQALFGTGMPVRAGECALEQHLRSGLNVADIAAAGGRNACRLLKIEAPGASAPVIPVIERPKRIIDMHAHFGCWERTFSPMKDADAIVASMDRCGIAKLVGSSFVGIHGEMHMGNVQTAEFLDAAPGRLFGYCTVNPNAAEQVQSELEWCFEQREGFVGLKFHCGLHEADIHHPGYRQALAYADAHALPVLVHGGGPELPEVAARYPGAPIILAHACSWDGFAEAGREWYGMAAEIPNVYVDVAGSAAYRGALRALVDLAGKEKVLYGSDFPMFDLAYEAGRVTLSDLPIAVKQAIARDNAKRLFSRIG